MLLYMGTRQPPRKYPVSKDLVTVQVAGDPCNICLARVWTQELYSTLGQTSIENEAASWSYEISSQELRESVQQGCKFCRTIADGVHGRVFLDELYERWNKTDSYPGTPASGDVEGSGSEREDAEDEAGDQTREGAEEDWDDASAFNEQMEEDMTGGWDAWDNRDTLIEACNFQITLSFERGEGGLFTFVNAYIEAMAQNANESNGLLNLSGEKLVELRYHINIDGRCSSIQVQVNAHPP